MRYTLHFKMCIRDRYIFERIPTTDEGDLFFWTQILVTSPENKFVIYVEQRRQRARTGRYDVIFVGCYHSLARPGSSQGRTVPSPKAADSGMVSF